MRRNFFLTKTKCPIPSSSWRCTAGAGRGLGPSRTPAALAPALGPCFATVRRCWAAGSRAGTVPCRAMPCRRPRATGRSCSGSTQRSPRSWRGRVRGCHRNGFRAEEPFGRVPKWAALVQKVQSLSGDGDNPRRCRLFGSPLPSTATGRPPPARGPALPRSTALRGGRSAPEGDVSPLTPAGRAAWHPLGQRAPLAGPGIAGSSLPQPLVPPHVGHGGARPTARLGTPRPLPVPGQQRQPQLLAAGERGPSCLEAVEGRLRAGRFPLTRILSCGRD